MAHVDLCSGIGGFALGFEWAELSKPVLFCDIEPWCRQILAKHWPDVPIAEDVKELANDPTRIIHAIGDRPSILTAGYPCQPFSQAGQRRGSEDDRHIWPEIFSIVQQVRPDWLICENVSGHITMGLDEVLSDLADKANYAVQTFHLGAVSVDAPHRRMRIWIVARNVGNSKHDGSPAPKVKGSIGKASKHHTQGQNKTSQSQRASEPRDSGSVGESASTTDVADAQSKCRNERFNAKREQTSEQKGLQTQIGTSCSDVADAISARGETWASNTVGDGDGSRSNKKQPKSSGSKADVPNTDSKLGKTQHQRSVLGKQNTEGSARGHSDEGLQGNRQWEPRSEICRMVDGIPYWVDEPRDIPRVSQGVPNRVQRLKGLGNAIVPQIAMRIGQTIKAVEETT